MSNKTRQSATVSAKQTTAIGALLEGANVTDAAKRAGVNRTTLHRWLAEDYTFAAELNRHRQDARNAYAARLLALADTAVGTVERAAAEDPRVALAVLKGLGLLAPPSIGATDPDELETDAASERNINALLRSVSQPPAGVS